ncbi:MAG TPA: hypothetical protein VF988_02675 [Verrucomicrobiae bacterium]
MKIFAANLFGCRIALAVLATTALPALAQQSIQFSQPSVPDAASRANAFLAPSPSSRFAPGAFSAPQPLFGDRTPAVNFDVLPTGPIPIVSPANAAQWRRYQDSQKNWGLMTPEEILNIPTPEKILNVTDPKDDPKLSAEERFLQRQQRAESSAGATNNLYRPDQWQLNRNDAAMDAFHPFDARPDFVKSLTGAAAVQAKGNDGLFQNLKAAAMEARQQADPTWQTPFRLAEPLPKQTPEQLAGMDRFRALMEAPAPQKAADSTFTYRPSTPAATDPFLQSSSANPAGQSYRSLSDDIAKPVGLTPLTGITGQRQTSKKITPLVQPPPWMSDSSQPATPPQRQY